MSAFATVRALATTAVGVAVAGAGLIPSTLALPTGSQSTDVATAPRLPQGMTFEEGLTVAQQERIAEIVQSAPTLLSAASTRDGGSCAAKTACYASTCWIPFVGLACLACDNVQCRREASEYESTPQLNVRSADDTCLAKKAFCYQVYCPLLPAGINIQPSEACKACDAIHCNTATARESTAQVSVRSAADDTCLAKKLFCYQVNCPLLPAGIVVEPSAACKACDAIQCNTGATVQRRESGKVQTGLSSDHESQLPAGMQFEKGLTASQQDRIVEIVQSAPTMLFAAATRGGGSCAAKTACYASTCWIPFVGLACLACDNVQC